MKLKPMVRVDSGAKSVLMDPLSGVLLEKL